MPDVSKTELRRLIDQNAVTINETKANDMNAVFNTSNPLLVRVGKKTFFKILHK
jgi:tyrosyl-tRNA synthetase